MKEKEIRSLDLNLEASENEDRKMEIKGYAVVFNSPETYGYTEVIDPHALDSADMKDVVLRYNHNDSFIALARTRNNSLKLSIDSTGLMIDAVLQNDISDHKNIYNAINSQLIDKQSFAFTVEEDSYDYETDTRTILKIGKLFDVSVVDQPFYNDTSVGVARELNNNDFLARRKKMREEYEKHLANKKTLAEAKERLIKKLG